MLVLNSSERWRVERERFSSFVCRSIFCSVFFCGFAVIFYQHWQSKICVQLMETEIQ
jgi:hypothetical protein